jgi:hypothetical protein
MAKKLQVGDSVYLAVVHETYTLATNKWAEADADTDFPKITVIDPDGTTKVDAVSMSNKATGKYDYEYEIPSDGEGQWTGYVDVENGTFPNREYFGFKVES